MPGDEQWYGGVPVTRMPRPRLGRRWGLVIAILAILISGGAWTYDLVEQSRAAREMCHGLLDIDDVRGEQRDPGLEEARYRDPGPGQPEMECAAEALAARSYPLPKAQGLIERITFSPDAGYRPLGPGLDGVTSADQAWLLMPCPDVLGGVPLFVGVDQVYTSRDLRGDDARRRLAAATVRAARYIGDRAGCGGPPLPDPQVAAEPAPGKLPDADDDKDVRSMFETYGSVLRPVAGEPLCGLVPASFFTADELQAFVWHATTPLGGTVDVCETHTRVRNSIRFVVVRGPAAIYAEDYDVSLTGTCDGRPALFRLSALLSLKEDRSKAVLREFTTRYAARQNCTVDPG